MEYIKKKKIIEYFESTINAYSLFSHDFFLSAHLT